MIAARTGEAKRSIPHFRVCEDIETEALAACRRRLNASRAQDGVSLNDLIVKACAEALIEVPALNVQWVDGEMRRLTGAHIAVVVALEDGVSTPIVRDADRKPVAQISREIRQLAARARINGLKLEEVVGGSFSVSNLGMYGVPEFDAIINPPQCAILAVGGVRSAVVPGPGDGIRIASLMRVTLSCDHRALDGAAGASFLRVLKRRLEEPEQLAHMVGAPP